MKILPLPIIEIATGKQELESAGPSCWALPATGSYRLAKSSNKIPIAIVSEIQWLLARAKLWLLYIAYMWFLQGHGNFPVALITFIFLFHMFHKRNVTTNSRKLLDKKETK